jgi:hypothetical protein
MKDDQLNITFDGLSVNQVTFNSSILVGENIQVQNSVKQKNNMGFGEMTGWNVFVYGGVSVVYDPDMIDGVFKS